MLADSVTAMRRLHPTAGRGHLGRDLTLLMAALRIGQHLFSSLIH